MNSGLLRQALNETRRTTVVDSQEVYCDLAINAAVNRTLNTSTANDSAKVVEFSPELTEVHFR